MVGGWLDWTGQDQAVVSEKVIFGDVLKERPEANLLRFIVCQFWDWRVVKKVVVVGLNSGLTVFRSH